MFEYGGEEICDLCAGKRFSPHVLQVMLHELNIADVLSLSVARAASEFVSHEKLSRVFESAMQFGLGQHRLDQRIGEIGNAVLQRTFLVGAMAKKNVRNVLYLMDQPFAGMDAAEVEFFMFQLRRETDAKKTFLYVTNDLVSIAMSDYVLELGDQAEIKYFDLAERFSLSDYE